MPFTVISYQDPTFFANAFPPPAVAFLTKVIESADPEDMRVRVAAALAEVVALNVLIAAAFPDDNDPQLTLTDCDLAGGGDGHPFVFTMFFVPQTANVLAAIIDLTPGDMAPQNFRFEFALAGEGEKLDSEINAALIRAIGGIDATILFQNTRGAAKGTRFMFCVGGLPENIG